MKIDDLGAANDAHAVLSAEVLDGLGRETSLFRGLPNAAFTTQAFLSLEHETLFKRSWVFAGRAGAVPKRGDVKPIQVVGRALFLVRGADERVRVFHNVCPHRGARLVIEPLKETSTLTCPYHAWSYELDGSVKGRPHFHGPDRHDRGSNGAGDASREDRVCLFEVRSAVWHDWVFVNLDGTAQTFDDYMTPIRGHFEEWDLSQFRYAHHDQFEFRCNWKLAVENLADFYHNFKVHPGTVAEAYVPEKSGPFQGQGVHLSAVGTLTGPERMFSSVSLGGLPVLSGLSQEQMLMQPSAVLFPNAAITVTPAIVDFIYFEPVTPGRTTMHMWYYFVGDGAEAPEHECSRQLVYTDFENANREDEGICARMQEGRTCDAYDGGRLSPYWDSCTAHFHRQLADAILGRGAFAGPG